MTLSDQSNTIAEAVADLEHIDEFAQAIIDRISQFDANLPDDVGRHEYELLDEARKRIREGKVALKAARNNLAAFSFLEARS